MGFFGSLFNSIGDLGQSVIDVGKQAVSNPYIDAAIAAYFGMPDFGAFEAAGAGGAAESAGVMGATAGSGAGAGFGSGFAGTLSALGDGASFGSALSQGFGPGATGPSFFGGMGGGGAPGAGGAGGFGSARSLFNIGSGLYGLEQSRKLAARSDPFAGARAGYASQLAALEANPGSLTSRPGYQAGLQAVQRGQAAGGYLGSGNEMSALAKFGTNYFDTEANRLATLAGAGVMPGNGYGAAAGLAGQSLASIGYGLGPQTNPNAGNAALLQQMILQQQLNRQLTGG